MGIMSVGGSQRISSIQQNNVDIASIDEKIRQLKENLNKIESDKTLPSIEREKQIQKIKKQIERLEQQKQQMKQSDVKSGAANSAVTDKRETGFDRMA